jgi:hypothetical protein
MGQLNVLLLAIRKLLLTTSQVTAPVNKEEENGCTVIMHVSQYDGPEATTTARRPNGSQCFEYDGGYLCGSNKVIKIEPARPDCSTLYRTVTTDVRPETAAEHDITLGTSVTKSH